MTFIFEKNKLENYIGEDLLHLLKKHKMYVAGGTITSLFTNTEINDLDIYAPNEEAAMKFMSDIWDYGVNVVSVTNKAVQMVFKEVIVQLIHFHYYEDPTDIFKQFDFTVCMGVYDFEADEFLLHPDFMKHNSQRILRVNDKTAYPIVSMLRIQKYEDKGYKISKAEFVRLVLSCMKLEINTYEELKNQLGGLYGVNVDKLFEDVKDEEFSLQHAIDVLADITLSDEYFIKPTSLEFKDLDDILELISTLPRKVIVINGDMYVGKLNGGFEFIKQKPKNYIELDTEEFVSDLKIYKFVCKEDNGRYTSFYHPNFEYVIGDIVVPKNEHLYFNYKESIMESTYLKYRKAVLIEATIPDVENINEMDEDVIKVNKVIVSREVPIEEWNQWDLSNSIIKL